MTAEADPVTVRKSPCAFCPYRLDAPSGIWHEDEYNLLPLYDGEIGDQAQAGAFGLFFCHRADDQLCAGWAGCHDMRDTLAARIHAARLDPSVFGYVSPVPLHGSGAEAAAHGLRDIAGPSPEARAAIAKVARARAGRGMPLR